MRAPRGPRLRPDSSNRSRPGREVTRAAAVDEETAAARGEENEGRSVVEDVVHPGQTVLGSQLFPLHLRQGRIVDRQYAEFGIEHLLVEFLVAVVQLPELVVRLEDGIELRLRLPFEHGDLLRLGGKACTGIPARSGRRQTCERPGRLRR